MKTPDSTDWGSLFEDLKPVKRQVLNPKPIIPDTGWKRPTSMPSLASAKVVSFDLETWDPELEDYGPGWGRNSGYVVGVAVSTDDGFSGYYPVRHREEANDNFEPQAVFDWCREELGRQHQTKTGFNLTYDLGWMAHEGVQVKGRLFDGFVAEKLINHSEECSLEATSRRRLGEGKISGQLYRWLWEYFGKGKNPGPKQLRKMIALVRDAPPRLAGAYAQSDTFLPIELMKIQEPIMENLGLMDVFRLEMLLMPLLVKMRFAGVSVDINAAERADCQFSRDIDELQRQVDHEAGTALNVNSGDEVGKVFQGIGIKCPVTEKTGKFSITSEFLETLEHPLAELIFELRNLIKFRSTFIRGYILNANVKGKVYGEFKPLEAITGRFSAANPNLQNVPSRNHLATMVRSIFVPDEGHAGWRKYDYSSIESRLLAHYAEGVGSDDLRAEYNSNPDTDYHSWTTAMVKEKTGKELPRKYIKNLNFAKQYGASNRKLASMMKLSEAEAAPVFEAFADGLPYVDTTLKHFSRLVEQTGETRTFLGRRVGFDLYEPSDYVKGKERLAFPFEKALEIYGSRIRRAYTHKAGNYVIQGSAADLMKCAMVQCHEDGVFDTIGVPRLVVHDELDVSMSEDSKEVRGAFREMKRIMETALEFRVPIRVAGESGSNWGDTKPLDD